MKFHFGPLSLDAIEQVAEYCGGIDGATRALAIKTDICNRYYHET